MVSDAHPGLEDAISSVLRAATWQRCRTYFLRDLLTRVPESLQGLVAALVRSAFAQPDALSVRAQHARIIEQLEPRFPQATQMLAECTGELQAFTNFPKDIGGRSGATTRRSGSTARSAGAPTSSASSRIAPRSSASSARCSAK